MPYLVYLTDEEVDSAEFAQLPPIEFKIYMILRRKANWSTGVASIADSRLGGMCHRTKEGARRAAKQLAKKGLIGILSRGTGRRFTDYVVRDLRGEILFTPGVSKNTPWDVNNSTPGVKENSPSTSISITTLNNTTHMPKKESTGGTVEEPAKAANGGVDGKGPFAHQSHEVTQFLRRIGIRGKPMQDFPGNVSLTEARRAWDRAQRSMAEGQTLPSAVTGYFIKALNGMRCDRLKIPRGENGIAYRGNRNTPAGPSSNGADFQTIEEPSPAAKKQIEELQQTIDAKRAASARRKSFTNLRKEFNGSQYTD